MAICGALTGHAMGERTDPPRADPGNRTDTIAGLSPGFTERRVP